LANAYESFFSGADIKFIKEPKDSKSNYWLNTIILKDKKQRDLFLDETNSAGVMTRPAWVLMNKLPMFKNAQKGDLVNAEWFEGRVVNISSSVIL
jgi:dTDP-4-amino-4,6-dideoxygalactose transaminase